jgi:hypothetical protein
MELKRLLSLQKHSQIEEDIISLKQEIKVIKQRNREVEFNKAWEVSSLRRGLVTLFTYFIICIFFIIANIENPYINALIPTIGFLISTLSFNMIKKIWIQKSIKGKIV